MGIGEVAERLNAPVSKTGSGLVLLVSSNLTLSATNRQTPPEARWRLSIPSGKAPAAAQRAASRNSGMAVEPPGRTIHGTD